MSSLVRVLRQNNLQGDLVHKQATGSAFARTIKGLLECNKVVTVNLDLFEGPGFDCRHPTF